MVMAKKTAEYPYGYRNKVVLPDYADYYLITAGNGGVVTKSPFRLAGVEYQSFTTSDAGTVVVKLVDGSTSAGTVIVPSTDRTINHFYAFPYVRFENGLFVDLSVSTSMTGVKVLVFGVVDDD
jgi:hypothetical protein